MDKCRIDVSEELGRYVAIDVATERSIATDRADWTFGRYVATEPWLELGRYFSTFFFFGDLDANFVITVFDPINVCKAGTEIGKKYFVCKHFENDGLHRKKEWDEAIEKETKKLTQKVDDHELKNRSLYSIEDRLSRLEEDEKKNAEEIEDLKYFLKKRYPNEFY
ncbi:hypothetical protein DY000_02016743 [Brassica cretica]|uniref:Uncharacterized protein n=1 Tax=Brassica cretica TaxID=69181 RepID=A0ABQ7CX96_BRACR|nr:hypothetical protein DY000_02016743 [Brassica cretica]